MLVLVAPVFAGSINPAGFSAAPGLFGTENTTGDIPGLFSGPVQNLNASAGISLSAFRYDTASGTWQSENGNQRIGILVTGSGHIILSSANGSAGLQLAGIGRDGERTDIPVVLVHAEGNRLELDRGSITEWYVNHGSGIEQGMTVDSRPDGNGTLLVNYSLTGNLRPVLASQTLVFFGATGPVLNYGGLAAYDAVGRELPATLSLSSDTLTWQIDDRDAVYPIVIDPWIATQKQILNASDAAGTGGAWFGNSVAISGNTAVIGANAATFSSKSYAGQVYIFTDSGGIWSQTAILNASDMDEDASFGQSVAISDDGNTAVIGANMATSGSKPYAGQAYVFTSSGGTWSEAAILKASDANSFDSFGYSVAISDDGNTAIIGAYGFNSSAGQAYIFTNSGGTWSQTAILNATDAAASASFGQSVAISDDGNTAVIGAYGFNSSAGQAYIFTGSGGTWSQTAILNATDATGNAWFGNAVTIFGDTALVGAPQVKVNGKDWAGKTYVFKKIGGIWSQAVIVTPSVAEENAQFGQSVAISGDTVLIGAYWAQVGTVTRAGKAYIFNISSSAPLVSGISPSSWPNTSSKKVKVSGNGFNSTVSPVVNLTRTGYSNITIPVNTWDLVDTTAFYVTIPSGKEAGVWNVTVINPDGEEGTNASVTFTITAPPRLTGISPASGANTAATLVTVTGTQFNSTVAPVVNLTKSGSSNISLTGTNLSATSFTVTVPPDADGGIWGVTVINPNGEEGTNASVTFTVTTPPRLTGISPAYGANATSTLVTITGSWFNSTVAPVVNLTSPGNRNVTLTGTNLSTTRFTVTVPNHNIAAIWNVTVINPDGLEGTNASVTFSTTDPPPVAEFSFDPVAGLVPLTVTFTDNSINVPESWIWDFGDGDATDATMQNPVHTYTKAGVYSVTLAATNYLGTGTKTIRKCITVMTLADETAILNASSDAAANDQFGASVAFSQDGNTALVGSEFLTLGSTPPGKVYVFQKSGGVWGRSAVLQASNAANSDTFGKTLALSDDGKTALIGADNANVSMNIWAGQVYVFTRNGGTWSQSAILNATDAADSAHFGVSLALSGDGTTALIGAYFANATVGPKDSAGQAYIFQKNGNSWSQKQILIASDAEEYDNFGSSVALSGETAVIGARGANGDAGQAYVFTNSGGTWSETAILNASDAAGWSWFGASAALSDDGNTAFIGAPLATVSSTDYAGKVYFFTRSGGTWSESAILSAPEAVGDFRYFGDTLAISGDNAVISDIGKNTNPGRAYVYQYDGESWYRTQVLNASDATGYDGFGWSVALRGTTALVGAAWATSGTTADAGQAYFFTLSSPAPVVAGISPASGTNSSATLVTITGTWFNSTAAPVVSLTRTGCSAITMTGTNLSSTSFTAVVPANEPAGVWNVTVTNQDGQAGTTPSVTYTVIESIPAPEVTGIDPPWGINTSDTSVTITGTGFNITGTPVVNLTRTGYANVTLGLVSGTGTNLVRTVPAHTDAGTWNLVVINPDGQEGTNTSVTFTVTEVIPAPVVTGISPSWGVNTSDTTVTITGSFFNTTTAPVVNLTRTGYANVTLGGVGSTGTALVRTVPANTGTGTWNLVVINPDGQEGTNASVTFTVTDGTSPPSTPTTDTESSSGDSATSGRPGTYTAGSPGATAGGTMTFSINEPVTANAPWAVISVSLVPSTTLGSTDIIVSDIGTMPQGSLSGRTTAGISDITLIGVNPSSVSQGTISFAVSGSWLTAHGLKTGDIVILRNHDGAWTELPTTFDRQDGTTYYFTATTPGFSYFAVTGRIASTATATPTNATLSSSVVSTAIPTLAAKTTTKAATPVPVAKQNEEAALTKSTLTKELTSQVVMIGSIAGIGIVIAAVVLYRRQRRHAHDPLRPRR
ncbi:MAG: IPT/TIG domain-containing protein [Methanoregulaceae archaeon]